MDKIVKIFFLGLFFSVSVNALAQTTKKVQVQIKHADSLIQSQSIPDVQRLIGNVKIEHEDVVMFCDSAYSYEKVNEINGYGNVHIIKGDTLNLYSNFVTYNSDIRWAKAKYNVKLINKTTTLTTDSLNYDMNLSIGYYDNYGTIIDSTTTLNSKIGEYHAKFDKAYFKQEVKVITPDNTIDSDTLIYETTTGIATIVGPTNIYNDQWNIYTTNGIHNTHTGKSDLHSRSVITSENQTISADEIFYDKTTGNVIANGNADMHDIPNRAIVKGNKVFYNEFSLKSVVTDSAQFWYYSSVDTLFLHADTLKTYPDAIPDQKIVQAYYGARFYRADLQGKCDSMVYWTRDSTMQMFYEPVIWSDKNQISSQYIEMITEDSENQTILMFENAFIIAQRDSTKFNQIKGRDMTGHIRNKDLYRVDVDGNGQSIFYVEDETGIIGVNEIECSEITIYLRNNKIFRINFGKLPDGQITPMFQVLSDIEFRLPDFVWHADVKPLSQYDIFRKVGAPKNKYIPNSVISRLTTNNPAPEEVSESGEDIDSGLIEETEGFETEIDSDSIDETEIEDNTESEALENKDQTHSIDDTDTSTEEE